jgi:CDP-diacylglycerol--serine O-phosphatidyltransferase
VESFLRTLARFLMVRHIPNALTSANLLMGCLGILAIIENWPMPGAYFIWAACVFDFFDGFAARWLKVSSAIGKELDSLADVVSFGVLPSFIMYQYFSTAGADTIWASVSFLLAVFSALRLAKFNIDPNQSDSFIGLPTPANALFISALVFLPAPWHGWIHQPWVLTAITLLFSGLLVSPLPLFALKFKNWNWAGNQLRFTFLLLSVLLLLVAREAGIALVITLYIFLSVLSGRSREEKLPVR